MRTSWRLSRRSVPATWDRPVQLVPGRRAARAWLLAGLALSLVLGLAGCGAGGGSDSASRSTTERSGTRPAPSRTESPNETTTEATRPPRTSGDTPTSDQTPTSAERPSSPTTTPERSAEALAPTSAPTAAAEGTPAAAESEGLGAAGWTLLILLVVALAAGWLLLRSRRKSAWDAQATALENATHTASTRLSPVLTAEDAGQRALSWPPLRAELVELTRRWALLAERAPDDQRRNRSGQVRSLLQELVAAVDSENEALATGRDWRLLRPRVDQAERALSAALAGVPQLEPAADGEPWQ